MPLLKHLWKSSKSIFFYALLMALLVFVLKWMQWKYLVADHSVDIYVGLSVAFVSSLVLKRKKQNGENQS